MVIVNCLAMSYLPAMSLTVKKILKARKILMKQKLIIDDEEHYSFPLLKRLKDGSVVPMTKKEAVKFIKDVCV